MEDCNVEKEPHFVFLDSGHDTGILTAELDFVIRNNISVIAFDDYSLPQVDEMIKKFLTDLDEYDKKNIASFLATTAGIIIILCFIRDLIQQ